MMKLCNLAICSNKQCNMQFEFTKGKIENVKDKNGKVLSKYH